MNAVALPPRWIGTQFEHRQSAHCESGTIASLLRHNGLPISEPMAFGISAALTFAYLPFLKFGGLPMFAYRMPPGQVIRGLTRRLGVRMHIARFHGATAAMDALDAHLAAGRPVGVQASAYWLSYFPPDMRFHFNAHNLVVYGKRDDQYLISDPVIDIRVECDAEALKKARFTRGVMAPKGLMYYPERLPARINLPKAIRAAIRRTTGMMRYTPVPIIGVRGIHTVARRMARLKAADEHRNKLLLGHIVRMQEEIGTGGAGFRFLYASFLEEAAEMLERPRLLAIADELTAAGDEWRRFALDAARMCKNRLPLDYARLADQLHHCANLEDATYKRLRAEVK
jgi:hypothetical protein